MKVSFFPGCFYKNIDPAYRTSLDTLLRQLGVETEEILNWSCCGTELLERADLEARLAVPLRNVAISEKITRNTHLFAPCPHCHRNFCFALETLEASNGDLRARIAEVIGLPVEGRTQPIGLLEILEEHGLSEKLKKFVMRDLKGLKVACYYGCKTLTPERWHGVGPPERVRLMERYLEIAGAQPVPWNKRDACNGGLTADLQPEALQWIGDILEAALSAGAQCVAVLCPVCFRNLDHYQEEALRRRRLRERIPIFYLFELLALAMGTSIQKLHLERKIRPDPVLKHLGIAVGRR